jgi:hypothetical protein
MGQRFSQQAASDTKRHSREYSRPQSQRLRREPRSEKTCVGDVESASRRNHRRERKSSRTRTTIEDQGNQFSYFPSGVTDGNIGSPRRQQKYGRSKKQRDHPGPNDQNYRRTHQDKEHPVAVQITNTKLGSTKSRASNPGSRLSRTHAKKECIICTDTRSLHHFPDQTPTAHCTHDTNVCRRCLRTWIESSFATKVWNEMTCPVCAAQMQYNDVRAFAPKDVFRR